MVPGRKPADSDWLRRALRCLDAGIAMLASLVVLWLMPAIGVEDEEYLFLSLLGCLILPAIGEVLGLYQPWRGRSLYTMLGVYTLAWLATLAALSVLLVLTHSTDQFSRLWMGCAALATLVCGSVLRGLLYSWLRRIRARGDNLKRVLLIGQRGNLALLERRVAHMPHAGYVVVERHVDNLPAAEDGCADAFVARIRTFARQHTLQREFDEIWLGYSLAHGERVRLLLEELAGIPAAIRYFPNLPDLRLLNHRIAQVAGLYSLELNYTPLNGPMRMVKALEDRILGTLLFFGFLPVMLAVAAAIRWQMGGPVLFKQTRHGLDGKRFKIYKFRTMAKHRQGSAQASYGDARITPLGHFLRRTSLDELPQLYNVLQGRMSLVGPRPHAMDHNAHYKDHIDIYMQRHRVKPGMTGWAQVNGLRGITDDVKLMQKRVELDLYYIEHWSFGLDIKILAMTLTRGFINTQP